MMTQTGIFGSQLPTYLLHLGAIISVRKEADRLVIRLSGKTSQQQILFFSLSSFFCCKSSCNELTDADKYNVPNPGAT